MQSNSIAMHARYGRGNKVAEERLKKELTIIMYNYLTLYQHNETGYVIRCLECNIIQMALKT